jgi:hypothetical protein
MWIFFITIFVFFSSVTILLRRSRTASLFFIYLRAKLTPKPRLDVTSLITTDLYQELHYKHNHQSYILRFPRKKGPSHIQFIVNESNEDVTKEIKPFMGPSHNFHGIPTCPQMLGYQCLKFVYYSGRIKIYREDEIIDL